MNCDLLRRPKMSEALRQHTAVALLDHNKINNKHNQQQKSTSWKYINIKHNSRLKKQKFMTLTNPQHNQISKYIQATTKHLHATISLQTTHQTPTKQDKNQELQRLDHSQTHTQIPSIQQKIVTNQQLRRNLQLLQQCSYETMTMPIKFKRFTGLLKQRYFYNSINHEHVGNSPPCKQNQNNQLSPQRRRHTMIIEHVPHQSLQRSSDQTKMSSSITKHFSPTVQIKKRSTSSVSRYKEDSLFCVKKRRKSVAQAVKPNSSLSFRHIEALSCTQRNKPKIQRHKADCQHISNSNFSTRKPVTRQSRAQTLSISRQKTTYDVQPWQSEAEAFRNVSEMEVHVKIDG